MNHRTLALCLTAACSRATERAAILPAAPDATVAWLAAADFVVFDRGDLVGYAVRDALVPLGRVRVAEGRDDQIIGGDWAGPGDLFAQTAARAVAHVTVAGVQRVTVPAPAQLIARIPPLPGGEQPHDDGAGGDLIVTAGRAVWSRCVRGIAADGVQCTLFVHAELWPTAGIASSESPLVPTTPRWEDRPAPAGFRTRSDAGSLRCEPPAGGAVELASRRTEEEQVVEARWISAAPPRLLVVYGVPGYQDVVPSRWALHDGCGQASIAGGTVVVAGPRGLWLAFESAGDAAPRRVIWRRDGRVGDLPGSAQVRFRP